MTIYGIDPGYEHSACVVLDTVHALRVVSAYDMPNAQMLEYLTKRAGDGRVLVIEKIENFGMTVGAEVLDTVFWSGRFYQAWLSGTVFPVRAERLTRREIKLALCNTSQAKDPQVRQALIDLFGPGKERAIGTRKKPGPLFGVTGHMWAALAVSVVFAQKEAGVWKPAAAGRWLTEGSPSAQ